MSPGWRISPSSQNSAMCLAPSPSMSKQSRGDEMLQPLDRLGRADEAAGAAPRHHALLAHREAAADRALVGELVGRRLRRAALQDDADDLRDHVAGALDDDGVAVAHVLAGDFVLVVQRRALHDDAADRDRLQHRDRGQRALAADRIRMSLSTVCACCAGNLCASAQRGARLTMPSRSCNARSLTL